MGRRANHRHFKVETFTQPASEHYGKTHERVRFACGATLPVEWKHDYTSDPKMIGCKDCAEAVLPKLAAECGLTLERVPLNTKARYDEPERPWVKFECDTRSLHKVIHGGAHIAWVYLNPGFGKGWQLAQHGLKRNVAGDKATISDVVPGFHLRDRAFQHKEQALLWLADEFAAFKRGQGGIDPAAHMSAPGYLQHRQAEAIRWVADKAARVEREKQEAAERQERQAKRESERAEAAAQLLDLAARKDLTNYQRAGLEWALERLNISITTNA